jgi:hypothetical protein
MFHALLRPLIDAPHPLVNERPHADWQQRGVRITALGEQVLSRQINWLDCMPATRWVGGVQIDPERSPWVVSVEGEVGRR